MRTGYRDDVAAYLSRHHPFRRCWFEICVFNLKWFLIFSLSVQLWKCKRWQSWLLRGTQVPQKQISRRWSFQDHVHLLCQLCGWCTCLIVSQPQSDASLMCCLSRKPAAFVHFLLCVCRRIRTSVGHRGGTTSWSRCPTPTSSGSGQSPGFQAGRTKSVSLRKYCSLFSVGNLLQRENDCGENLARLGGYQSHSSLVFPSSIMNSLVIVLFLSGMVAMIMLRTLHKDIARYNQMDSVVGLPRSYWLSTAAILTVVEGSCATRPMLKAYGG